MPPLRLPALSFDWQRIQREPVAVNFARILLRSMLCWSAKETFHSGLPSGVKAVNSTEATPLASYVSRFMTSGLEASSGRPWM